MNDLYKINDLWQKNAKVNKEQYEKMIVKLAKKQSKSKDVPSYEDTYNSSLLLLTLTFIVIGIQIHIPSITTKKTFPGCIRSFKGYPLDGSQDKSSLIYISCVANKIKSSIKPWNTILKISESTNKLNPEDNNYENFINAREKFQTGGKRKHNKFTKKYIKKSKKNKTKKRVLLKYKKHKNGDFYKIKKIKNIN